MNPLSSLPPGQHTIAGAPYSRPRALELGSVLGLHCRVLRAPCATVRDGGVGQLHHEAAVPVIRARRFGVGGAKALRLRVGA